MRNLFKIMSLSFAFCIVAADITFAQTNPNVVHLTSLEWPPYIGKDLPEQGAMAVVAKEAFKAVGYTLEIDFFPWARAVALAKEDKKYAGYFPEYYSSDIEKDFTFSAPMGDSPLGFVESKSKPVSWTTLDDLKTYTIGTVREYVNTDEFDKKAAKGELKVEPVTDDETNLLKVAEQRISLAVIDNLVMNYLLRTSARLKVKADKVQFNSKLLENKKLFICFKKDETGKNLNALFAEGLKKIDAVKICDEYFKSQK